MRRAISRGAGPVLICAPVANPPRGGYHLSPGRRMGDPRSGERAVRLPSPFIAGLLLSISGWPAQAMTDDAPPPEQRADAVRRHGLDPTSPLESRVKGTPPTG